MPAEHRAIKAALDGLIYAAHHNGKPTFVQLGEKIILHAQTEEQMLYPAACLVGDTVRLKLGL